MGVPDWYGGGKQADRNVWPRCWFEMKMHYVLKFMGSSVQLILQFF